MSKLTEGLKTGDLNDLVLKEISIDEFESKIDDERAIVVGFYVDDKDPADDLRNFLDKSATELLDSDRSPAPDPDGYYMVFAEFERNKDFVEEFLTLLETIENLVDNNEWEFTTYKDRGPFEVNEKNLKKHVRLKPNNDEDNKENEDEDEIEESLRHSTLDSFQINGNRLTLANNGLRESFHIVRSGSFNQLESFITESTYGLSWDNRRTKTKLHEMLGTNWDISVNDNHVIIYNPVTDHALALQELN